jgi:hypothetical protein
MKPISLAKFDNESSKNSKPIFLAKFVADFGTESSKKSKA